MNQNPGKNFRELVAKENPLQIVGTVTAYNAIIAKKAGHKAIYLSGGGVAACSLGVPDLAITTMQDVLIDAGRITNVCDLPLLVDIDTGWGGAFNIGRAIKEMIRANVAAVHIEDQVAQKRCGHRPNKEIVSKEEMVDRIKAAVDARYDENFVIIARTDALASEGIDSAIERAIACVEAGADMIFPEAIYELKQYQQFSQAVKVPILANITEFGKTPLFHKDELAQNGVSMVLYPLSAFRAMAKSSIEMYETILNQGTQESLLDKMQDRHNLYEYLNYYSYEESLDKLFQSKN